MEPMYLSIQQKETGKQIKKLLMENGYTVKDVQNAMGFENPQAIYKWISGRSLPSLDNFVILSRLLHTSIEDILVVDGDVVRLWGIIHDYRKSDCGFSMVLNRWEVFGSSAAIFMLEMMRMKNYWKMSDFSLFAVPYAYVDHSSYLADQLFVQNKITMKFKGEMVKDGSAYCIVFCKVLKRDVARFEEALERLKDKMLLLGHKDYPAACGEIAKMIEEDTKARMRK